MFTKNTLGAGVATEYFKACTFLKPEEFHALLGRNVTMVHTTNGKEYRAEGIEEVYRIYKEKLFDQVTEVDLVSFNITGAEFKPKLKITVVDKREDEEGKTERALFVDNTTLTLGYEEGELLIQKIDTVAEKTLFDL